MENLKGSGMIAGESSLAYEEIITMNLVRLHNFIDNFITAIRSFSHTPPLSCLYLYLDTIGIVLKTYSTLRRRVSLIHTLIH